jgi:folate-binding protein YgfZ
MVEPLLNRLRTFVLRADVTLEDTSEAWIRVGLSGPDALTELESAIGEAVPQAVNGVLEHESFSIIRVPGTRPRFEIYATLDAARKIWDALNVRGAPVGASVWELLDILAGVPTIYPQTSELFIPQMANMQLLGGVSFKKGCYPGQEVVARMQYLGTLKRRMYLVQIDTDTAPEPGDEIFSPADAEQNAGRIVNAQAHPDGGYRALAVIQISSASTDELFLGHSRDARIELLELPYAFENAEETG